MRYVTKEDGLGQCPLRDEVDKPGKPTTLEAGKLMSPLVKGQARVSRQTNRD